MTTQPLAFVERVLTPATSRVALTWPVVVTSVVFSVFIHLFGSIDLGREQLGYRVFAAAAAMAPMFLLLALAHRLPARLGVRRMVLVLAGYFIGGAMRGVVLSLLLDGIGVAEGGGWRYRVPAGALNMGSIVCVVTFGWAVYFAHRQAAAALVLETRQLQSALTQLEAESNAETLRQISDVSAGIARELHGIALQPADEQVDEIQRVIDERVRPLSRELAADIHRWAPERFPIRIPMAREVWATMNPLDHLPSPWFTLLVSAAPFPLAAQRFGALEAVDVSVLLFATLWPAVFLGNAIARRLLARVRAPMRELFVTGMFVFIAALGVGSTTIALQDTSAPHTFVLAGLVTFPMYSWVALIGLTYWADARHQEQRLRNVRSDLQWAIARVNLITWFNRGVITRLLHGPIQNAMHATVIRLRSRDAGLVVDGVIEELRQRILAVEPLTGTASTPPADFRTELLTLARVWSGIASVTIECTPQATRTLATDAPAAAIALDLCNEALSNAVRHGAATGMRIECATAERALVIRLTDNGREREAVTRTGVGTQFIDTVSLRWTRSRKGTENHIEIQLPCEPAPPA